jgi:RHS repeat-associated protein
VNRQRKNETSLHYNWNRSYDQTLGRYTQPDPLGFVDGPSVYGYTRGLPQILVDIAGLLSSYPQSKIPNSIQKCQATSKRDYESSPDLINLSCDPRFIFSRFVLDALPIRMTSCLDFRPSQNPSMVAKTPKISERSLVLFRVSERLLIPKANKEL